MQILTACRTIPFLFSRGDMGQTHCKYETNGSTIQILFLRGDRWKTHCKCKTNDSTTRFCVFKR